MANLKYSFEYADNGVIIKDHICDAVEVVEYDMQAQKPRSISTNCGERLGVQIWDDIDAYNEEASEEAHRKGKLIIGYALDIQVKPIYEKRK